MRDIELDFAENAALRFLAGNNECQALKEFREGVRLLHNRYPARALVHFMHACDMEKDNPYFMSYLGLTLALAHRRWKEAEEFCETALRMRRNQAQLHLNLAQVHLAAGRRGDAMETLQAGLQFTARDPRLAHALNRLGNRRRPIFPFLGRKNALNRYAGRLRHLTLRLLHVA